MLPCQKTSPIITSHHVPPLPAPTRLQEYGVGIFPRVATKSALKKAIKRGYVSVNGMPATTATLLTGGETLTLSLPVEPADERRPDLPLDVLLEDDYLAIIRKPAGVLVSGNSFRTVDRVLPGVLNPSPLPDAVRPRPVHRLDYATSGALLVGKTADAIRRLNGMFAAGKVTKTYFAITYGEMPPVGTITADVDGKSARTDYAVLRSVPSARFGRFLLVELRPRTGRRHQLRQHLAGIGHPILGDREYTEGALLLKGKGLYLHASELRFEHPRTGAEIMIRAKLPDKFERLFPGH